MRRSSRRLVDEAFGVNPNFADQPSVEPGDLSWRASLRIEIRKALFEIKSERDAREETDDDFEIPPEIPTLGAAGARARRSKCVQLRMGCLIPFNFIKH